jgi:CubicO group peptidase (beta-lactamase class C family)
VVRFADPSQRGAQVHGPDRIDGLMEQALSEGIFPGAALLCARAGGVVIHRTYGQARRVEGAALLTLDARFDLASLSKALGTSVAAMVAWEQDRLRLGEPLGRSLPVPPALGAVTPWHLLSHSAGLPAWLPLHERARAAGILEAPQADRRAWMRRQVAATDLEYAPGSRSVYSDLGFMLLEWLLELRTGERLDRYLSRHVFVPLGLTRTGYVDLDASPRPDGPFVATERCAWRGRVLEGEVHDHNTWVMGGVCGQAGLFSTAGEVHLLVSALWQSWHGTGGLLAPATLRRFWEPAGVPGSCWRLGWDGPSPQGYSAAGRLLDRRAVGHLGFTGCSLWLDPRRGVWVVLLTNRVHPRADDRRIGPFRPVLHDLLVRELGL